MDNFKNLILVILICAALSVLYFNLALDPASIDKLFLTISTFLFSIFSGFFISRQAARYSDIRKSLAAIDGNMSAMYRASGHLGADFQSKVGGVIKEYYELILKNQSWDYNFTHKTTTLISLHALLEERVGKNSLSPLEGSALGRVTASLGNIQMERKNLVALYEERIPFFQWAPIYFLATVLFITLSITVPSFDFLLPSILKGAFATAIIVVLILLRQLDSLRLFEGIIGEHSAKDVIEIIEGDK